MTVSQKVAPYWLIENSTKPYNFREHMIAEAETPGLDDMLTTDDLDILMPEVINRQIITIAEAARLGRNFVDVIPISGNSVSWIKEFGFAAAEIEEGAEIPIGKTRYEKLNLTVIKTGVRPLLTYESIADANIGILQRNLRQASLAMARLEDVHIMTVLNSGVPDGSAITGTYESDHSFAASGNALVWEDLVKCYTSIIMENLSPGDIIIHPYQAAQFLQMKEFRSVVAVGATPAAEVQPQFGQWNQRMEAMYGSARIGTILGCNVWITANQTAATLLMIDRNNYGVFAERQPLMIESDRDIIHQLRTVALSQRYIAGILNNDGAANITGLASSMP